MEKSSSDAEGNPPSASTTRCPVATSRRATSFAACASSTTSDWPDLVRGRRPHRLSKMRQRGDYAASRFQSRNQYRDEISRNVGARSANLSEFEVAKRARSSLPATSSRPGDVLTMRARRAARMFASSAVGERRPELGDGD